MANKTFFISSPKFFVLFFFLFVDCCFCFEPLLKYSRIKPLPCDSPEESTRVYVNALSTRFDYFFLHFICRNSRPTNRRDHANTVFKYFQCAAAAITLPENGVGKRPAAKAGTTCRTNTYHSTHLFTFTS
jgi:hypothetical protein